MRATGLLIGRRGATIELLQKELEERLGALTLKILELRRVELEPLLVVDDVLGRLGLDDRPSAAERIVTSAVANSVRAGAKAARVVGSPVECLVLIER